MNLLVIERESIKSENNEPKNEKEKNKSNIEENLIINEEKQDEENDDDKEEEKEEPKSKKDKKNDVKKGNSNGDFFETMVGNFDQNAITDTMKIFEDNKTYKVKNIKVFLLKFFS